MTENRDRDRLTDASPDADADEEPTDTRTSGYPPMPPLADADPEARGEDEPTDTGWAGAARAAEGEETDQSEDE
jgi:hypothetical protein